MNCNKLENLEMWIGLNAKGGLPGLLTGKQIDLRDESEYNLSIGSWSGA
jgi:hypothetical protein